MKKWIVRMMMLFCLAALSVTGAAAEDTAYPVEGGNIYFNPARGAVTDCDETVTKIVVPEKIGDVAVTVIDDRAFADCSGLTSVTFPEGITWLGKRILEGSAVTEITIPTTVTYPDHYDAYPFAGCESLKKVIFPSGTATIPHDICALSTVQEVVLPEGVTTIGSRAFRGCESLQMPVFPQSLTDIGSRAFSNCTGLTGELVLPQSLTDIGSSAFYGCTGLTGGLVLPQSLTSIGDSAFWGCTGLTGELVLPESVTKVGEGAFYDCTGFTKAVLSSAITAVPDILFGGCSGLTSVILPEGIEELGGNMLKGSAVTEITVPTTATSTSYYHGDPPFAGCESLKKVIFASGTTTIPDNICAYSTVQEVVLPEGVTKLGSSVFLKCENLQMPALPQSLTSIGSFAFEGCTGLTGELVLPDTITEVGNYAFQDCTGITKAVLSSAITNDPDKLFSGCSALSTLIIPEGITKLGSCIVMNTAVTEITIPSTVTRANSALQGCESLKRVIFAPGTTTIPGSICDYSAVSEVVIPEGVTVISGGAFYYCESLQMPEIPQSLTDIQNGAFQGCTGLTGALVLPKTVSEVGNRAFSGCTGLTGVYFADNEQADFTCTVGESAFEGCTALAEVALSKNVLELHKYAFKNCAGLTALAIPEGVTYLGEEILSGTAVTEITVPAAVMWARSPFEGCEGLETVTFVPGTMEIPNNICSSSAVRKVVIPESVTTIRYSAFYGCTNLQMPELPEGLTTIENGAFYGCTGLTGELVLPGSVTVVEGEAFRKCTGLTGLTVGSDEEGAGACTLGQNSFMDCTGLTAAVLGDNITSIGLGAFRGCSGLQSVTIPDRLTTIDEWAFYNCSALSGVLVLPGMLTRIDGHAFENCSSLTGVVLSGSDGEGRECVVNGEAFAGCSKVSSITIPEGVTRLGGSFLSGTAVKQVTVPTTVKTAFNAFKGCSKLETVRFAPGTVTIPQSICSGSGVREVVIPDGVTEIKGNAFYECQSLKQLYLPASITKIGDRAFVDTGLEQVRLDREDCVAAIRLIDMEVPFTAYETGIREDESHRLDRGATALKVTASETRAGQVELKAQYAFKPDAEVTRMKLTLRVPTQAGIVEDSVTLDGAVVDYKEKNGYITVSLENTEGAVGVTLELQDASYMMSYAQIEYTAERKQWTETVGIVNIAEELLTISAPSETSGAAIVVQGVAAPGQKVELYLDGNGVGSVTASATGGYQMTVTLPESATDVSHRLDAKSTSVRGEPTAASTYVTRRANAPQLTQFTLRYRAMEFDMLNMGPFTTPLIVLPQNMKHSYSFVVDFDDCSRIEEVRVVSTKRYQKEILKLRYSVTDDCFVGWGFSGDVLGSVAVEYREKTPSIYDTAQYGDGSAYAVGKTGAGVETRVVIEGEELDFHVIQEYEQDADFDHSEDMIAFEQDGETCYITAQPVPLERNGGCFYVREIYIPQEGGGWTAARLGAGLYPQTTPLGRGRVGEGLELWESAQTLMNILETDEKNRDDALYYALEEFIDEAEKNLDKKDEGYADDKYAIDRAKVALNTYQLNKDSAWAIKKTKKVVENAYDLADAPDFMPMDQLQEETNKCIDAMQEAAQKEADNSLKNVFRLLTQTTDNDQSALDRLMEKAEEEYKKSKSTKVKSAIDPSGYVYEGVDSNRVEGVKATIYYRDEESGQAVLWDAAEYDQSNPLYTDELGWYAWDVPEGLWQVKYEKEGYETAYSDWLPVPPPQLEVNVGLTAVAAPEVTLFNASSDGLELVFSQYMDVTGVNDRNVQVGMAGTAVAGSWQAVNAEESPDVEGAVYATIFRFTPEAPLTGSVSCTISGVENYAGTALAAWQGSAAVQVRVYAVQGPQQVAVKYSEEGTFTLVAAPGEAAQGLVVRLESSDDQIAQVADSAEFNADGIAVIKVSGKLPGEAKLRYTVEGTTLSGEIPVYVVVLKSEVPEPEPEPALTVTARAEMSGSTVRLTADSDGTVTAVVAAARYDSEGRQVEICMKQTVLAAGQTCVENLAFAAQPAAGERVKVFLMDAQSFAPLCTVTVK